jgi:dihydroneopterin aldolase
MDIIYISELKVEANLGVYEWEKRLPQTVEINLEFAMPGVKAGASDSLSDTIDYAEVTERIRKELAARRFELLEALAEFVANLLLNDFGSPWVKVNIAKIGMMRNAKRVGVTIQRRRRQESSTFKS